MKLTQDQKRALMIGGGVAIILLAFLLSRRTGLPTAVSVQPPGTFDALDPPGYTTYNVQPIDIPSPGISNAIIPSSAIGCGCATRTDGCFTSNPLDNGQGPLSLAQLMAQYGAAFPQFLDLVKASQDGYATPPPNIGELAQASSCPYNPLSNFALSGGQRAIEFYQGGGFHNPCWFPSVNGY